jgi:hypothetical protein
MGVEYYLVSDSEKVGYELGKYMHETRDALKEADPVAAIMRFMMEAPPLNDLEYAARIATEVVAFAKAYPDWRMIDDCSSDIAVMTDETRAELRAEDVSIGEDPDEFEDDFPTYRQVGSRYVSRSTAT